MVQMLATDAFLFQVPATDRMSFRPRARSEGNGAGYFLLQFLAPEVDNPKELQVTGAFALRRRRVVCNRCHIGTRCRISGLMGHVGVDRNKRAFNVCPRNVPPEPCVRGFQQRSKTTVDGTVHVPYCMYCAESSASKQCLGAIMPASWDAKTAVRGATVSFFVFFLDGRFSHSASQASQRAQPSNQTQAVDQNIHRRAWPPSRASVDCSNRTSRKTAVELQELQKRFFADATRSDIATLRESCKMRPSAFVGGVDLHAAL